MPTTCKRGVHYGRLESDLSRDTTSQILQVLERPDILSALRRNRVGSIAFRRLDEKSHSAYYDYSLKAITVNTARKPGVHFGERFEPGKTGNMSAATTDKLESMRRALLQELAHHFENGNWKVQAIRDAAFGDPQRRPITRYGRQDATEYLAESLVVYIAEPEALFRHDPIGSMMIRKVLSAVGSEQ